MTLQQVAIIFEIIVFLFAICVHESAHAYVAWRCGDPTARMLGRVTLNPIKHIDLWGTILIPLIAIVTHFPIIGWAKPTPVNSRNFRNVVRSDILTSVAGPVSNILVAVCATAILAGISLVSREGSLLVKSTAAGMPMDTGSTLSQWLLPLVVLLYEGMLINVLLAVFNIIPIPPLDGSHVLRHFIPESALRAYEIAGTVGFILLFLVGGRLLFLMMAPFLNFFNSLLMRI